MVGSGKRVLELGSGPGSITRILHQNDCRITALEINPEAVKRVASFCDRVFSVDLNATDWTDSLAGARFERVVAADVLEHLIDPLATLRAMKSLVDDEGFIVISVPHAGHAALLACLLNGDFEYHDYGLLDRTHIRFFGIKNIQPLFEQAGLKIIDVEFVIYHPEKTEFAHQWDALPTSYQRLALSSAFSMVYQIVIKAVPVDRPGVSICPTEIPVPLKHHRLLYDPRIRKIVRLFHGRNVRKVIRKYAAKLGITV
jgi:2-polyprenyl-3-methyl-5-hydroxy-6-metoxy-1,4-benzoquinol methylase